MQQTPTQDKKKKLLTAAAIFAVPILALSLITFKLFHKPKKDAPVAAGGSAFNAKLPSPNLPKDDKNKFELYMQAQQDSMRLREAREKDPNINKSAAQQTVQFDPKAPFSMAGIGSAPASPVGPSEDQNVKKVDDHLQRLYAALNSSSNKALQPGYPGMSAPDPDLPQVSQTEKLEKLMTLLQKRDTSADPQLQQVNQVLDKIIQIKNPPQPGQAAGSSFTPPTQTVATHPMEVPDGDDPSYTNDAANGFFGLTDDVDSSATVSTAIKAIINEAQTVESGSIVQLRLMQDIFIGTNRIPANTFIRGKCSIDGERVDIQLSSAIYNGNIYPIKLKVFDGVDGLEGLYVPGTISRDAVKEGMSQGVNGVSIGSLDPSLGAQAAQAGIETAKSLIGRKIRLVKVTLKAGHIALLKNPDLH